MTEVTIESVFGTKARIVWEALNKNGPSTINDIVKATGLRGELVYGALGWLGRENKISVKMGEGGRGKRALVFSLHPYDQNHHYDNSAVRYACRFLSIRLVSNPN